MNQTDRQRSEEELAACVSFSLDSNLDKALIIATFSETQRHIDTAGVIEMIEEAIGLMHLEGIVDLEAAMAFLGIKKVRDRWLALIIRKTLAPQ